MSDDTEIVEFYESWYQQAERRRNNVQDLAIRVTPRWPRPRQDLRAGLREMVVKDLSTGSHLNAEQRPG